MNENQAIGYYIDKTLKKLQSVYLKAFAAHSIDLTLEQWAILHNIYRLGNEASQAEIAKSNFRNRATTSRVIGGLCKKGLVLKDRFEGDSKRFRLTITESGSDIVNKVLPIVNELRTAGKSEITVEDFNTFIRVLDKVWTNYDQLEE